LRCLSALVTRTLPRRIPASTSSIEDRSGGTDKRLSGEVFAVSRLLANQQQRDAGHAFVGWR
jgi:hypothetical protein